MWRRDGIVLQPGAQFGGLSWQVAESWPLLEDVLRLAQEIRKVRREPSRLRAVTVPPRVVIDNHASNTHTVIEVNGRDRPGLLHDVTAAMSEQGMQIASAHITTYGVRAVDVFYVKDIFGLRVENERKLAALRKALLEALAPPETEAGEGGGAGATAAAGAGIGPAAAQRQAAGMA